MSKHKRFILILLGMLLIFMIGYFCIGARDYLRWLDAKEAVAFSGYPWQCGAFQVTSVTPGCVLTPLGCSCKMCESLCNGSTQVTFVGQPVCMGYTFACISPEVIPRGGPLLTSRQMIFGGFSNLLTANSVVGTQTLAASRIEKVVNFFNYAIAGFKK